VAHDIVKASSSSEGGTRSIHGHGDDEGVGLDKGKDESQSGCCGVYHHNIVLLLSRLLDAVSRYDVMIRHNQWFLVGVTFKA
jgi:hypothetical protein